MYSGLLMSPWACSLEDEQKVSCSLVPEKKDKYRREGKGRRRCLWAELIQFLAALDIFYQDDVKKRINSAIVNSSCCKIASAARD